jgi:transposase
MEKDTTHVALDDSKRKIVAGILWPAAQEPELREITNDPHQIRRLFERLQREGPVAACYEAGVSGYDLHRQLTALGVTCSVIAPALTPRRPGQHVKTDRRDAAKLTAIHVLDEDEEAVRAHWRWIREQRFILPPLQRAFEATLFALAQALARQAELDHEIEAVATTAPYREPVAALRGFRGIDTLSAIILLAEIVDFQRFRRPRELMAYLGLVPSEYSSGETHRRGALTKAGNRHARRVLVEAAWHYRHRPALATRSQGQPDEIIGHAWRAQQRLHRRYRHLVGHGKRSPVAVVAVARELVGFIWAAMTRPDRRPAVA